MEGKVLSEHSEQEKGKLPVQSIEKGVQKGRSRAEKDGRIKYTLTLLKRVLDEVQLMRETQRVILNGLKGAGYFKFGQSLLLRLACQDQADVDIVDAVREAGSAGVFPKDVAASQQLQRYGLKYYGVSRRIERMNDRVKRETSELLFEKRGHRWALTRFALENFGVDDVVELAAVQSSSVE